MAAELGAGIKAAERRDCGKTIRKIGNLYGIFAAGLSVCMQQNGKTYAGKKDDLHYPVRYHYAGGIYAVYGR